MAASIYTLAELQTLVYARLENNSVFYTDIELTAIINEAIQITNMWTGFYQSTEYILSVMNQQIYSIPSSIVYAQRIQFDNTQLEPVALNKMAQAYRTWTTDTTDVYGDVARWVPIGINLFAIHPIDSSGGANIQVTGVAETPLLVAADDTMAITDQYVNIVVEYCAHRLPLKEGGAIAAQASALYPSFLRSIKSLTSFQQVTMPRFFVMKGAAAAEGRES